VRAFKITRDQKIRSPKGRPEPLTAETAETAESLNVLCALGELGGEKLLDTLHATACLYALW
jgi:hypothetical protein